MLLCSGDEDLATRGLRNRTFLRAGRAGRPVAVDLGDLSFADSSFVVDLAMLARRLRLGGGELELLGARPTIRRLIEMAGLHHMPNLRVDWPVATGA
jgi:anti-anti-sigma factor